jgi:RNA polymerase sigma-70 factor (ECF subfamily)
VLLADQDRSRWDRFKVDEGRRLVERALRMRRPGAYQLQAAIAALHDEAASAEETDWAQIAAIYDTLAAASPSAVVELNRAVAVAMADGPEHGLPLIDAIADRGELESYPYLHAARADLLRRLGRMGEAAVAYQRARELTENVAERSFLERRYDEVTTAVAE